MTRLFLNFKDIQKLTGFSRTTIWRLERAGNFPNRIQISLKKVGWSIASIRGWAGMTAV